MFSHDGSTCAASVQLVRGGSVGQVEPDRYEIALWDLDNEEYPDLDRALVGHVSWIGGLDFSPREDVLASGSFDHSVALWDPYAHERVDVTRDHRGAVYAVAFSPDGRLLASCSADNTIRLWSIAAGSARGLGVGRPFELTREYVLTNLLAPEAHGQSPLTELAQDVADRLVSLRSRKMIEDAVADVLRPASSEADYRLTLALFRVLEVRLEGAYRGGDTHEAEFYHWLQLLIDATLTDALESPAASASRSRVTSDVSAGAAQGAGAGKPPATPPLADLLIGVSEQRLEQREALEKALSLRPGSDDLQAAFDTLNAFVQQAFTGRRQPLGVAKAAEILLEVGERSGASLLVIFVSSWIGALRSIAGDHAGAVAPLERAVEAARQAVQAQVLPGALGDLGNVYRNLGQLEKARRAYIEAIELTNLPGLESQRINHLNNLAIVYRDLGDRVAEGNTLRQARVLAREYGSDLQVQTVAIQLGSLYHGLGDYEGAVSYYREALAAAERNGGDQRARASVLGDLGRTLATLGRKAEAFDCQSHSLELAEATGSWSVAANAHIHLARLLTAPDCHAEALEHLDRAIALLREHPNQAVLISALIELAALAEQNSAEISAAVAALEEVVALGEQLRGEISRPEEGPRIQRRLAYAYAALVRLHADAGRADEAFLAAERGRAVLLVSHLQERPGSTVAIGSGPNTTSTSARMLTVPGVLASLKRLGPAAVLVAYFLTEERLYTFVLRADDSTVHVEQRPLASERLNEICENFVREVTEYQQRGDLRETWLELEALVVEPLTPYLREGDLLFIVPHGLLHKLPLHALRVGKTRLIERWAVAYLPAVAVLQTLVDSRTDPPERSAAVGVEFVEEAQAVAQVLTGCELLVGDALPKARVIEALSVADTVHLSTHGFFSKREPRKSGLLLRPVLELKPYIAARDKAGFKRTMEDWLLAGQADNVLAPAVISAEDVEGLQIRASLVVLSACESGVAAIDPAEDAVGLVPAFLEAGARAVLASLWLVDPDATRNLMVRFYQQMNDPALGWSRKSEALQRAIVSVMRDTPHPYFWAGFVLIGAAAPAST